MPRIDERPDRIGTADSFLSAFHWAAQSRNMGNLLHGTFPKAMTETLGEAGEYGFAPLSIKEAPRLAVIRGNLFTDDLYRRRPLTFKVLSRNRDLVSVRLFINYADRFEPYARSGSSEWMFGGRLAAHDPRQPNEQPDWLNSIIVIVYNPWDQRGQLYLTRWMMDELRKGTTKF